MAETRLESELHALSDRVFPATPPLVEAVMASVVLEREREPRRWFAAIVAAVIVAAILLVPAPRRALARLLGIGGVSIEHVTDYDLPEAASTDQPLGREVDLEEAAGMVGFTPRLPDLPELSDPMVFVRTDVASGLVSLVYRNAGEEPGLIITQFRTVGEVAIKQLPAEARWREVDVSIGVRGFWIEGAHTVAFYGPDDVIIGDSARLVGDTLLWQVDGLTYRIESGLPLADVLRIARSMGAAGT